YLGDGVGNKAGRVIGEAVFDLEGQPHIEAVEPDLMGVAQLVPVIARFDARVTGELGDQAVGSQPVFALTSTLVQRDEGAAGQDVVDVEFFEVVADELPLRADLIVHEAFEMAEPRAVGVGDIEQDQATIDAAVLIAPVALLIGAVVAGVGIEPGFEHYARSCSSGRVMRRTVGLSTLCVTMPAWRSGGTPSAMAGGSATASAA